MGEYVNTEIVLFPYETRTSQTDYMDMYDEYGWVYK